MRQFENTADTEQAYLLHVPSLHIAQGICIASHAASFSFRVLKH